MDRSQVEVVVTLAETTIRTADLIGLRVGDIITTEKDVHTPLEVSVQGVPNFTPVLARLRDARRCKFKQPKKVSDVRYIDYSSSSSCGLLLAIISACTFPGHLIVVAKFERVTSLSAGHAGETAL